MFASLNNIKFDELLEKTVSLVQRTVRLVNELRVRGKASGDLVLGKNGLASWVWLRIKIPYEQFKSKSKH